MWKYVASVTGGFIVLKYIYSSFAEQTEQTEHAGPKLEPPSVTLTGARFPADGSRPHLITLKTTPVDSGTDSYLSHVPDLRSFWQGEQSWESRVMQRLILDRWCNPKCNGTYLVFYTTFPLELPATTFPFPLSMSPRGDIFVVKLQSPEYGGRWATLSPHRNFLQSRAAYDDVPEEFPSLPEVTRVRVRGLGGRHR
ncbi:hypothetical protein CONLIGDRAFT_141044 [Coniochaeta ligniaria NRRL 30616]|uniref:Uncharacterized protein n=1 Tax=Coniochaeta ligniaria NRRL 30616 TaxID=1408157 RepID=A0A1J7I8E4_9PEZI|nr:hypothetical protein CONLIGDRAFT_141044 [Coniochaeta ligniaria NRRL 30616]